MVICLTYTFVLAAVRGEAATGSKAEGAGGRGGTAGGEGGTAVHCYLVCTGRESKDTFFEV